MTIAICTLPTRLTRSLLTRLSSSLRECSSSLTVFSSSLVDCSSSFAVSSSSLVLCSSSLLDRISSFADCSSSFAASSSWMIDCRYSRLASSSRCSTVMPPVCLARLARARTCRSFGSSLPARRDRCARTAPGNAGVPTRVSGTTSTLDADHVAAVADLQVVASHGLPRLARRIDRAAHAVEQAFAQHLHQAEAGVAGRGLEERAGLAAELDDLQIGVDHHAGRRVAIEDQAADLALQAQARWPARARTDAGAARATPGSRRSRAASGSVRPAASSCGESGASCPSARTGSPARRPTPPGRAPGTRSGSARSGTSRSASAAAPCPCRSTRCGTSPGRAARTADPW